MQTPVKPDSKESLTKPQYTLNLYKEQPQTLSPQTPSTK